MQVSMYICRPGKSCKMSSSGRFKVSKYPQNSVIRDKGRPKLFVLNIGVAWSTPQILFVYPQSTTLQPHFWILNPQFSIIQPQFSLINPQFSIFNTSSSIFGQKCGIFNSKCPQNSVIRDKGRPKLFVLNMGIAWENH